MALVDCSECGKQISDKAAQCPNCGAPLREFGRAPAQSGAPEESQNARASAIAVVELEVTRAEDRLRDVEEQLKVVAKQESAGCILGVVGLVLTPFLIGIVLIVMWLAASNTRSKRKAQLLEEKGLIASELDALRERLVLVKGGKISGNPLEGVLRSTTGGATASPAGVNTDISRPSMTPEEFEDTKKKLYFFLALLGALVVLAILAKV